MITLCLQSLYESNGKGHRQLYVLKHVKLTSAHILKIQDNLEDPLHQEEEVDAPDNGGALPDIRVVMRAVLRTKVKTLQCSTSVSFSTKFAIKSQVKQAYQLLYIELEQLSLFHISSQKTFYMCSVGNPTEATIVTCHSLQQKAWQLLTTATIFSSSLFKSLSSE